MTSDILSIRGRGWAYTGVVIGGLISITANVAHSFVAPAGAPEDWAPKPGAVISAMAWPILLFIALEILARVAWLPGFWWGLLRFGGMLPIVAITGIVSWRHQRGLLIYYGEDAIVSFLGPLAVDGLMVMSTTALLVIGIRKSQEAAKAAEPKAVQTQTIQQSATAHRGSTGNYTPHRPANTHSDWLPVLAPVEVPTHLLSTARFAVNNHQQNHSRTMTADELASAMNIPAHTAGDILASLADPATITVAPVLNGTSTWAGDHK